MSRNRGAEVSPVGPPPRRRCHADSPGHVDRSSHVSPPGRVSLWGHANLATVFNRFVAFAIVLFVQAYQFALRPLLLGSCKFCPSCSEYAIDAIRRHGPWRGGWLSLRRVCRCHPWSQGGIDPVPDAEHQR